MIFAVSVKNPPAGTRYWYSIWYIPPNQWEVGYIDISSRESAFIGVPADSGWLYVDVYDTNYRRLSDGNPRGYITPVEGWGYEYDFVAGKLTGIPPSEPLPSGPLPAPEYRDLTSTFSLEAKFG